MQLITLHVPKPDLEAIEQLVTAKKYPNRSEFIRLAIHQVLHEELRGEPKHV